MQIFEGRNPMETSAALLVVFAVVQQLALYSRSVATQLRRARACSIRPMTGYAANEFLNNLTERHFVTNAPGRETDSLIQILVVTHTKYVSLSFI